LQKVRYVKTKLLYAILGDSLKRVKIEYEYFVDQNNNAIEVNTKVKLFQVE